MTSWINDESTARSAERKLAPLVADMLEQLKAAGWKASEQRFYPDGGLMNGHRGYVLGIKVNVEPGDPRIEWRKPKRVSHDALNARYRGMALSPKEQAEAMTPVGFAFTPGAAGTVTLLSDTDHGSGVPLGVFFRNLHEQLYRFKQLQEQQGGRTTSEPVNMTMNTTSRNEKEKAIETVKRYLAAGVLHWGELQSLATQHRLGTMTEEERDLVRSYQGAARSASVHQDSSVGDDSMVSIGDGDGAYVEMQVWVPRSSVNDWRRANGMSDLVVDSVEDESPEGVPQRPAV